MRKEYIKCMISICSITELEQADGLCTDASAGFDDELIIEW